MSRRLLVDRDILEHRTTIVDGLVALAMTDCDYRTLRIVAEQLGVGEQFDDRTGLVMVVDNRQKIRASR